MLDLRKNGELGIDGGLKIYAQIVDAANTTGSVTTVVQTSADGAAWTDVASQMQNANLLVGMSLPFGLKRFVRLKFAVGATQLGSAVKVKAGLVDQFDMGELPPVQSFPLLEDIAADGDALFEPLVLAASSGSIAKGGSGTVAITAGAVTAIETPSDKYTVTVASGIATIALAATAASGTVYFVDGLGNKAAYAVTASS